MYFLRSRAVSLSLQSLHRRLEDVQAKPQFGGRARQLAEGAASESKEPLRADEAARGVAGSAGRLRLRDDEADGA